jgi:hypothetical protein
MSASWKRDELGVVSFFPGAGPLPDCSFNRRPKRGMLRLRAGAGPSRDNQDEACPRSGKTIMEEADDPDQ